ncbi:MAG: AAA family ATPase, partial [Flavobacteriales bacterium]|nr:AAA family ATPase [Flavobacteriales bacterium]
MSLHLHHLSLINFKNYDEVSVNFDKRVQCFLGNNGEGKTNLLDAIYYLAFSKSAFQPTDSLNIKKGAPFFVVQGTFSLHDQEEKIHCGFKKG